jgi:E1A/CREB-binding protein
MQCTESHPCPVTRHCSEMKAVWNHILIDNCHDPNCRVKHCVSSRYVMSHYMRKQSCSTNRVRRSSS